MLRVCGLQFEEIADVMVWLDTDGKPDKVGNRIYRTRDAVTKAYTKEVLSRNRRNPDYRAESMVLIDEVISTFYTKLRNQNNGADWKSAAVIRDFIKLRAYFLELDNRILIRGAKAGVGAGGAKALPGASVDMLYDTWAGIEDLAGLDDIMDADFTVAPDDGYEGEEAE